MKQIESLAQSAGCLKWVQCRMQSLRVLLIQIQQEIHSLQAKRHLHGSLGEIKMGFVK